MSYIDLEDTDFSEKEKKILEAACDVFAEKGYSAATTNEIAKHAGVAEGTIFRYFKTKKHILRGLLIQLVGLLADKVAIPPIEKILTNRAGKDERQVLKEVIKERMALVNKNFPLFKVVIAEALYHEDIREIVIEKIVGRIIPIFDQVYQEMVAEGRFRKVPSVVALRAIVGNIMIFIASRNIIPEKLPVEDLERDMDMMLDVLLNGIAAPRE